MNKKSNMAVHGGRRREFADKYGLQSSEIIDFSVNINPLGPSPAAVSAIKNSLNRIIDYPDGDILEFKKSIAAYNGVNRDNIVVGNGSIELIYSLMSLFRPKHAVVIAPTFTEYERAAGLSGAKVKNVFLTGNYQNLSSIDSINSDESDIIFICNPNNPTGALYGTDEIENLSRSVPNAIVVIDEAFMDFINRERDYSFTLKAVAGTRFIVLRSLGKFFALAGLRLGYLITDKETAAYLALRQPPWNINNLTIAAAMASINDKEYITYSQKTCRLLREDLYKRLTSIKKLKVYSSHANFFLVKILKAKFSADMLQDKLAADNILIRTASDFKGLNESYFRLAVRDETDNRFLAEKLGEILA
ncbi:MAG TPA: threonine-phosphate decarboxylase [Actinobacteria bacterium]|nr:threonine-phosphate decarboxylase [Actinomycetes bacterium]HEX21585.1 threonine-phosphate decarboxylase [Actinomycetota bacterium]